jgi:hypothetical protein
VQKRLANYLQINRKGQQHCGQLLENQSSRLDNAYTSLQFFARIGIVGCVPDGEILRGCKIFGCAEEIYTFIYTYSLPPIITP